MDYSPRSAACLKYHVDILIASLRGMMMSLEKNEEDKGHQAAEL